MTPPPTPADDKEDIVRMMSDSAQGFLARRHDVKRLRTIGPHGHDGALWSEMAGLGWLGIMMPEELGGSGMSFEAMVPLLTAFGRVLLPEPVIHSAIVPSVILAGVAAGPARDRLAHDLVSGDRVIALAGDGLETVEMRTEAEPTGAGVRIANGRCLAAVADCHMVTCWIDGDPWLVAIDRAQCSSTVVRMADGTLKAWLTLDGIEVPEDAILARGETAHSLLRRAMEAGTLASAIWLESLATEALGRTVEHLRTRTQFGRTLSSFQALRHRIVDLKIASELSRCSWQAALAAYLDGRTMSAELSAAKASCSDSALSVGRAAIQMHGALGYTEECDVGLYFKSALRWSSEFGTADEHRRRLMTFSEEGTLAA